jgi:hypothetical protein
MATRKKTAVIAEAEEAFEQKVLRLAGKKRRARTEVRRLQRLVMQASETLDGLRHQVHMAESLERQAGHELELAMEPESAQ